ncbi:transmembrane protein 54b isoform X2 [Scophthalmus maximus]|uniref:transmembrane protein 54b isoform X2 n=1 Tax=Scophthalmus maximus TaxID=52904 RepID=UPI0015E10DD3|nr:transmembrane protein 54b isoform X2 [Scophthalmus maximus]
MAATGLCCSRLEEPKALMKMGLCMLLLGHVNFLLGALVHGVVLRHINLHKQARAMEYAISNVVALTSGLVGIVVGILAIILSKNKRSRGLTWSLFTVSLASAVMATASAIGLLVSVVRAILHGGRSLLTHCRFPDATGYSSITNECPFDPTRIYMVFSAQCLATCTSFLGLPCCPTRKSPIDYGRSINVVRPIEEAAPSLCRVPSRGSSEPPTLHAGPPRSHREPPKRYTAPPRELHRPPPPPRQHRSLPPSERQPLHQPHRERPETTRAGGQQRPPEQHQLLERGALQRSSFWI